MRAIKTRSGWLVACTAALLGACAAPREAPRGPATAATTGAVGAPTGTTYRLLPQASVLRVLVYRGGALAALGHNHVLRVQGIDGTLVVPESLTGASGEFSFPVEGFVIDDPAERSAAGADFPGEIDAADIAGTRHNLLGADVLDAQHWPRLAVRLTGATGSAPEMTVHASFIVRGLVSNAEVPVRLSREAATLVVDGEATLSQAALGLKPFSVMLGALRVEDGLRVRFHLVAAPSH